MLWSVTKIIVFIGLVIAASFGAVYLLELDGGVTIQMAGQEFVLTPFKTAIVLILLIVSIWVFLKLASFLIAVLRFINGDETAISRYFDRSRQEKGYRALSEGMMALASGEGDLALTKASKAERYLRKPALTNLLTAQAAEMSGNRKKAEEVYKRLLTNEKTRFVGVRGIMKQKLADGDTETALKLAETAFALKPRHVETQDTLLQLQAKHADWKGARETLRNKLKYGSMPRDLHKRRDAVLALTEAMAEREDGKQDEADAFAIEANRLSPDLIPAAAMAARAFVAKGNTRKAAGIIRKTWGVSPHPDLAAAFAEIEPDETPEARLKRFTKLFKLKPDHRETKLVQAELHISAEDFPAARRAVAPLVEHEPDARALTIMAAIERGEGASDAVVKGWLARALTAPRGPAWVCDVCQHIHAEWRAICKNCGSFDSLSWRAPPVSEVTTSTGIEMLPLIVGAIEDHSAETESDDEIVDAETVEMPDDAEAQVSEAVPSAGTEDAQKEPAKN
ncbi:MAG: heme biosynthesis HemY N-terminal domain-containing protein [Pseudomonadota bacterium]